MNILLLTTTCSDSAIIAIGDNGTGYHIFDLRPTSTICLPMHRKEPGIASYLNMGFCMRDYGSLRAEDFANYQKYEQSLRNFSTHHRLGISANPLEWMAARSIAKRAILRGFEVHWSARGANEVSLTAGRPTIHLNWFASRTATIEEYLHATIIRRELDRGVSLKTISSHQYIMKEEIRLKSRLLGGLIQGLDREGLQDTYLDYLDRYIQTGGLQ